VSQRADSRGCESARWETCRHVRMSDSSHFFGARFEQIRRLCPQRMRMADEAPALDQFRAYLLLLARAHLRGQGHAKLVASDIVQRTLLEAHRKSAQFRGGTHAELAAWLRRLLTCTLADVLRALGRVKRDAARERSLEAALDESSARLEAWLAADQSSPS